MNIDDRGGRAAAIRSIAARLAAAGIESAEVDARWLVDHVTERCGTATDDGAAVLEALVERRAAREPVQVIIGRTWFRELELSCAAGVFVPRPETEVVAGLAIEAARRAGPSPLVAEPCTGTGAIALSVAAEVPGARILATDLDANAVALARSNLARLRSGQAGAPYRAAEVEVLQGHLLDPLDQQLRGHVDVLVANPPYLPARDRGTWEPEVGHDPDRALIGGPNGHEVVDALLASAAKWLRPGGIVIVEIDERRSTDAVARAEAVGLSDIRVERDLTGAERAVVASRPAS